jgi:hypothetical protein
MKNKMTYNKEYEERVFKQYPSLKEFWANYQRKLLNNFITQEKWFDAIENSDVDFLNQLIEEAKKRYQKWLSDEIMNTKTFKYYVLMYLGNCYWYFDAKTDRSKVLDKKVEQNLRDKGYSAEDIAKIFVSKRYRYYLEEAFSYKAKENKVQIIDEAISKVDEFIGTENEFCLDENISELQQEWGRKTGNPKKNELLQTKGKFLKERLLS